MATFQVTCVGRRWQLLGRAWIIFAVEPVNIDWSKPLPDWRRARQPVEEMVAHFVAIEVGLGGL
jgi:hypothetical protein